MTRWSRMPERRVATTVPTATAKQSRMNKLEQRYAQHLGLLQSAGEIEAFRFEAVKLRLAKATFYTPDFLVVNFVGSADSTEWPNCRPTELELYEVKGHWRDDARVKIKVAAEQCPWFRFVAVKWHAGQWQYEEIG